MKIQLKVLGISLSHTMSGAYALILEEVEGKRRIPLIIGDFEAQAIVMQIEKMQAPRPLTHELFAQFAELFNIQFKEVDIYGIERGIFYTRIVCDNGEQEKMLEARTSDAVVFALRFGCPIYTTEEVMEKAGIVIDFKEENKAHEPLTAATDYSHKNVDELKQLLDESVEAENYEEASKIRDAIKAKG